MEKDEGTKILIHIEENMKESKKWTQELRKEIYRRLVRDFGPYSEWDKKGFPKEKSSKDFEIYCIKMAEGLKMFTGKNFGQKSVLMQIRFAITKQQKIKKGHAEVRVMNLSAALETGFLSYGDLFATEKSE